MIDFAGKVRPQPFVERGEGRMHARLHGIAWPRNRHIVLLDDVRARPLRQQIDFVRELANWWRQEVKADITASLGSSRADYKTPQPKKSQRGLFAQFIQTAAEGIPGNEGLSWDRAIRRISEEKR